MAKYILWLFLILVEISQCSNGTFPVIVSSMEGSGPIGKELVNGTVHVWHKFLNQSDALDLVRISVSIDNPEDLTYTGTDPILEVMISNGRDSIAVSLPVVHRNNLTAYVDAKMLSPILPEDVKIKKKSKKHLQQNLIITVQSRLKMNIPYSIHMSHLDRSQYEIRFKPDEHSKVLSNIALTFVKPIGFLIDPKKQNIRSLKLSLTSVDDICATLVVVPENVSLYESRIDTEHANQFRLLSFTKRADVYFTDNEVSSFESFRIFVFINPDDATCDPTSERRKYLLKTKKVTFEFVRVETDSYFLPICVMLAVFFLPLLIFAISTCAKVKSTPSEPHVDADNSRNLITLNDNDQTPIIEENLISVTLTSNNTETPNNAENLTENEISVISGQSVKDSFSTHREMLQYPLAIIIPVFMHTGLEYHKWMTSSTANRDEMCFHNHACAQPYGEFRAINNIISNIGYFLFGLLFVGITFQRRARRKQQVLKEHGTYECVLLDVTIGAFLMMQAVASATYHICPSDVAFQFDTPFIQVICGLLITRQWFIRKESPSAAYSNSILVAVVFLNFLISAFSHSPSFRYWLGILQLSIVMALCAKKNIDLKKSSLTESKYSIRLSVVFVLANITVVLLYISSDRFLHLNQISTCFFILNCACYLLYYTFMKMTFNEKVPTIAKLFGSMAVIFWIAAIFFFLQEDTDWTKTAAQSRALNKPCVFLNFFGYHDMWHIFGAFASLFTFVYVQYTDDDLSNVPRRSVNVF